VLPFSLTDGLPPTSVGSFIHSRTPPLFQFTNRAYFVSDSFLTLLRIVWFYRRISPSANFLVPQVSAGPSSLFSFLAPRSRRSCVPISLFFFFICDLFLYSKRVFFFFFPTRSTEACPSVLRRERSKSFLFFPFPPLRWSLLCFVLSHCSGGLKKMG